MTSSILDRPAVDSGRTVGSPRGGKASAFGWRFTTPLYMGSALNPINSTVIATALVAIAHGLHVSLGRTSVLVSGLYLACAIAQPTAGKLSEELGPRRVFVAGIITVLVGGFVGGFGQNLTTLLVSRVLIGIGTSAGYPSAMLMIRRRASVAGMDAPPGNVLGGLAIAGMAIIAIGPPIGGLLVGTFGWRAAFLINVPFALVALAMALFWIPRDAPAPGARSVQVLAARIDVAGIVGFGGAMIALLVFLMSLPHPDWIALGLAVGVGTILVVWELRARTPFFDVRLLGSNMALTRTYIRSALTLLGVYVILYGLTQWLEAARGFSAEEAGLVLLPMGALAVLVSRPISGRNLVRSPLIAAALSLIVGAVGVLFLTMLSSGIAIVAVALIFGITIGTTTVGNQTALYNQAPANHVGTAAGLLRTFGYLGSIAAATITGIAFRTNVTDSGLHSMAIVLITAGVVVLVMTLADRQLQSPKKSVTLHTISPTTHIGKADETDPNKENLMTDTSHTVDAQHTVLLVMDYQSAALGLIPEADDLLSRVNDAISIVRGHGGHVGYVRVGFDEDDYAAIPAANKMFAAVGPPMLHHDAPESAVHGRVAPEPGDIVVRKTRVGAFSTTDLDQQLRERGITTIILAGIATSGVVLSTVRDAADRDYRVFVLSDGSADPDPDVHGMLMEKVFPGQADVITVSELPSLFSET